MTSKKVLTATLIEVLADKQPFLSLLADRAPEPPAGRIAPPSSRPPRSSELPPRRPQTPPPPEGPDRGFVAPPEPAQPSPEAPEPVATKKPARAASGRGRAYPKEVVSEAVSRVLAGESRLAVGKDIGVSNSIIGRWVATAETETKKQIANQKRSASMKARSSDSTLVSASSSAPAPSGGSPEALLEALIGPIVERVVRRVIREKLGA